MGYMEQQYDEQKETQSAVKAIGRIGRGRRTVDTLQYAYRVTQKPLS